MLELQQVQVIKGDKTLLDIDYLKLSEHEITVILGHNGSGKSTLMKLLARQMFPEQGALFLDNQPLSKIAQQCLAKKIAYLPQNLPEALNLTAKEVVEMGRFPWQGHFGRLTKADRAVVSQALRDTHTEIFEDTLVSQLSGGERQRVWIAMLLAQATPLMLLDEPTSALDISHQYEIMRLLQRINQTQNKGMVVVLHDVNLATRYADRVIALHQGRLVFDGTAHSFMDCTTLSQLYGVNIDVIAHPQNSDLKIAVVA